MDSLPLRYTIVTGAVYTAIGVLGLALTGFDHLTAPMGPMIAVFQVNGLLSLAHLVAGLTCLAAAVVRTDTAARNVTMLCAAAFGTFGLLGLAMVQQTTGNVLALNAADTTAHLVTAIVAVTVLLMEHTVGRATVRTPEGAR